MAGLLRVVSWFAFLPLFTGVIYSQLGFPQINTSQLNVESDAKVPFLWSEIPSTLDDFPRTNETVTIDPWNFVHRMGLYKILINLTDEKMSHFGYQNTGNILWGLALQHSWQLTSGRLNIGHSRRNSPADLVDINDGESNSSLPPIPISPRSWWAAMNYYLSVLPFLGALKAGYFPEMSHQIKIMQPDEKLVYTKAGVDAHSHQSKVSKLRVVPSRMLIDDTIFESNPRRTLYCTLSDCDTDDRDTIEKWVDFFNYIKHGQGPISKDHALKLMWVAHVDSIRNGLKKHESLLTYMSQPEVLFGVSWAHLVGFIADTRFCTDLNETAKFQGLYIPKRVLTNNDQPPYVEDMSTYENRALAFMSTLQTQDTFMRGALQSLWSRAMCSSEGRVVGRKLMSTILLQPIDGLRLMFKMIWSMIWHRCG